VSNAYQGRYAEAIATVVVTTSYMAEHLVFLAVDHDAHVLGFYSLTRDPPELDMLFVADQAQGQGIGPALVKHMMERARQIGIEGVRVVSHPDAEEFYAARWPDRRGSSVFRGPSAGVACCLIGAGDARGPSGGS
jgi:GNAT superfamily N-acetyltransferase